MRLEDQRFKFLQNHVRVTECPKCESKNIDLMDGYDISEDALMVKAICRSCQVVYLNERVKSTENIFSFIEGCGEKFDDAIGKQSLGGAGGFSHVYGGER